MFLLLLKVNVEVPFVDLTHEHAHAWVPICTHMYTHTQTHTHRYSTNESILLAKITKKQRKETNSQGDTISIGEKNHETKIF